MRRGAISLSGFEAKFEADADPWDTWRSRYEAVKRDALSKAIGLRSYARGLELAAGNGSNTPMIAARTRRLLVTDGTRAGAALMQRRFASSPRISVVRHDAGTSLPGHRFELIVISELLYYLGDQAFAVLAGEVGRTLAPGGRLVMLHHEQNFADRARQAGSVHRDFLARLQPALTPVCSLKARLWRAEAWQRPRLDRQAEHCSGLKSEVA